jgi:hydroxyethylthiazole kinase-like uncharacterized protein yjeF
MARFEGEFMYRVLPESRRLPHALYRAEQVREFDRLAIEAFGIAGRVLMERAGAAAYRELRRRWPRACDITVLCGVGNNAGDGYVVARLARADGLAVQVLQLGDAARLAGDALGMREAYQQAGGAIHPYQALPKRTDVLVDAVLGTGLERAVSGQWAEALKALCAHRAPVLAIDIPSGLHADTGRVMGQAAQAEATVSFIGLKQGMFTAQGADCCGEIVFSGLEVPAQVYSQQILAARRVDWRKQRDGLPPRRRSAHKGDFGHVLVIGGAAGFSGAARLAGEAALRCGAGLVSVATHPAHASTLNLGRPELMCHAITAAVELEQWLGRASVAVVGPGLGQGEWGAELLRCVLASGLPLVLDADALNLLAQAPQRSDNWILTPHPGEAARLLSVSIGEIQADRFAAARQLHERYGGTIVLKGSGTLIHGGSSRPPAVCSDGNPGMASGGMGDALSGLIAGFVAQGFEREEAAVMGVCLHGAAADQAALARGERGLLASDLWHYLGALLNPLPAVPEADPSC